MIKAEQFAHRALDPWRWTPATGPDVEEIVALGMRNYRMDGVGITDINAVEASRNVMFAVINQAYAPLKELITVARLTDTNELVAFTWAQRDQRHPWSTEEMIMPRMLSVELTLSSRCRVALCVQAMMFWEKWAHVCKVQCIASNNMREDWSALMHLHQDLGYLVRGSMAFKRLKEVRVEMDHTNKIILP